MVSALDARPGSAYRIEMHHKDGDVHTAVGVDTVVTISLRADGKHTEMSFLHEKFATVESRDKHEHGWTGCLARLEKALVPATR